MDLKLITPEKLAEMLGVSRLAILRQVQGGKIPHFKWGGNRRGGGAIRFTARQVQEIIEMWSLSAIEPGSSKGKRKRDFETFKKEVGASL